MTTLTADLQSAVAWAAQAIRENSRTYVANVLEIRVLKAEAEEAAREADFTAAMTQGRVFCAECGTCLNTGSGIARCPLGCAA